MNHRTSSIATLVFGAALASCSPSYPTSVEPGTPVIVSLSPSVVAIGSTPTVTIEGQGFVAGNAVLLEGFVLPTIFVSGNRLTFAVSEDFTRDEDRLEVRVARPEIVGRASNALVLTVTSQ